MNRFRAEVEIGLNGQRHLARLTLGALVELEEALGTASLAELAARFDAGTPSAAQVQAVLVAGLRGGGWTGRAEDFLTLHIEGGPLEGVRSAGLLLARAFSTES